MNSEIKEKKSYLLHWMYDFIEDDDEPAYLVQHVEACDQILTSFINEVAKSQHKSEFSWLSAQIEDLVNKLNALNFKLDHQLIESDQREDICALVELIVRNAGHDYPKKAAESLSSSLAVF